MSFLQSSPIIQGQITNLQAEQAKADDFKEFRFTDIFLVFDYERQDPSFDATLIMKMLAFWSESTENGLLYVNYPMIEAYKHLKNRFPIWIISAEHALAPSFSAMKQRKTSIRIS